MSITKYNVEIDTEADKIEKPASRWRNRYLAKRHFTGFQTGKNFAPGDMVFGFYTYPSKDIAETAVLNDPTCCAPKNAEYLGAFPEGQDANH